MAVASTSNRVTPPPQAGSGDAILVVDNIAMRFTRADGVSPPLDDVSFNVAPGRIPGRDRAVGLRQVDVVQHHRRPARRL